MDVKFPQTPTFYDIEYWLSVRPLVPDPTEVPSQRCIDLINTVISLSAQRMRAVASLAASPGHIRSTRIGRHDAVLDYDEIAAEMNVSRRVVAAYVISVERSGHQVWQRHWRDPSLQVQWPLLEEAWQSSRTMLQAQEGWAQLQYLRSDPDVDGYAVHCYRNTRSFVEDPTYDASLILSSVSAETAAAFLDWGAEAIPTWTRKPAPCVEAVSASAPVFVQVRIQSPAGAVVIQRRVPPEGLTIKVVDKPQPAEPQPAAPQPQSTDSQE